MPLKDLVLREVYAVGLPGVNALHEFLIPVLGAATSYRRVTGYFSSAVLADAAKGIAGLVANGGTIQLVTSHNFTRGDAETIGDLENNPDFAARLISEFNQSVKELMNLGSAVAKNHLAAMCWLLKEGRLDIRVVVPKSADEALVSGINNDLFHTKFGIAADSEGDSVLFTGSVNETSGGWVRNLESISVFNSWLQGREAYVSAHEQLFNRYWDGTDLGEWETISLPEAVKREIVDSYAPDDFPVLEDALIPPNDGLRQYQRDAYSAWVSNERRGILEMATGTGKTRTAAHCIKESQRLGTLLTVVIAPYQHIADQWELELAEHQPVRIESPSWRKKLDQISYESGLGRTDFKVLIVVKNTAASSEFTSKVAGIAAGFDNFLLVGDEVHWLGAASFQRALMEKANFRLGLSATPARYFDDDGTDVLTSYFDKSVYTFSLRQALVWIVPGTNESVLCPYEYKPVLVELSEDENSKWRAYSQKIAVLMSTEKTPETQLELERLRIQRSMIAKKAASKVEELPILLKSLGENLNFCLIYCADREQMDQVAVELNKLDVHFQRITGEEGTSRKQRFNLQSEREYILESFARGKLDVLLAIQCLDEGVDIPAARIGIILASSGNPKEFIQRRGRLMRRAVGKTHATIYDFAVLPEAVDADQEEVVGPAAPSALREIELRRVEEFGTDAQNSDEILELISQIRGSEKND